MKKWMAGALAAVMCITLPAISALAYAPSDSDFGNVWGSKGCEITADAQGNAKLVYDKDSDWGGRLSYMEGVKLDGLEITLTNVEIEKGAAPTLVISNEQGQWVDSDMPTFIHAFRNSDSLGAVEHGFLLGKSVMDDAKPRMINETAFSGPLTPEMKLSFKKKNDTTWTYTVNGQAFDFDATHLSNLADLDNVYLNFGNWTQKKFSTSFVVANIKEDRPAPPPTEPPATQPPATEKPTEAPTQAENSKAESSATTPVGGQTDKSDVAAGESSQDVPANGDEGGSSNVALYIVLAVVILACIGAGVFIVLKYVVKKPEDKPK